jgi:hypothetical protein
MSDNTYNGWTNFETHQAAVWLGNHNFLDKCQEAGVAAIDSEMLEDELYELANGDWMQGLAREIYNCWISCVNLNEIAEGFNETLTAMAEEEDQWWADGYTTRIYNNGFFLGTREVAQ